MLCNRNDGKWTWIPMPFIQHLQHHKTDGDHSAMNTNRIEEIIVIEKLAVFTFDDEITERSLREYFKRHWDKLTVGMKKSTILFMGGVHGEKTGELGRPEYIETLQNQVRIICVHFFFFYLEVIHFS